MVIGDLRVAIKLDKKSHTHFIFTKTAEKSYKKLYNEEDTRERIIATARETHAKRPEPNSHNSTRGQMTYNWISTDRYQVCPRHCKQVNLDSELNDDFHNIINYGFYVT